MEEILIVVDMQNDCETVNGKILNVSYPNEDVVVIVIRYKNGE